MESIFLAAGLMVLVAAFVAWHLTRSRGMLAHWAESNDYRLINQERRYFFKGPYFWSCGRGQEVYRVEIEDKAGQERSGWVRCGHWFWGSFRDEVAVSWDQRTEPGEPSAETAANAPARSGIIIGAVVMIACAIAGLVAAAFEQRN